MNQHMRELQDLGQRLWLDNISRTLLRSGTLQRYIGEFCITGLTANPTLFEHAVGMGSYDESIRVLDAAGLAGEEMFFELAMEDLTQAADLLRPIFDTSDGADGWVSLELSPLLADNTALTIQTASKLFARAAKANLLIKIPGTPEGTRAIEEVIFDGIPVNVTLLFSREHYLAAAEAYMRGIERRLASGLDPRVASVASLFVSRWDVAVMEEISSPFHNRLGIAMAMRTYRAHLELLGSKRWRALAAAGARPQRLVWASIGTKDPAAADTLYAQALTAPNTIISLPEATLLAFADHGLPCSPMPPDGGYADAVLEEFRREGVDDSALADRLQHEGVDAFATSWHATLSHIREKSAPLVSEDLT